MPQRAVKALFDATRGMDPIITTEVGQHQMWAAQHFGFSAPNRWLTSGGLGTMGYGFPAAVGAQIAHPNRLVVRSEEHTSELQSLMRISYAVFCLKKKKPHEQISEVVKTLRKQYNHTPQY